MTRRILGPEGSKRRKRFWLVPVMVAALATVFWVTSAQAVHDTGAFELDGNATKATSHDWDQVCFQATSDSRCGTSTGATAKAASWTADILKGGTDPFANNSNATIFTGGGSKDPQDINQWAWKDGAGGLPDKDNLVHSFAARYSLTATNPANTTSTHCPNGTGGTGQPAFDSTLKCELLFFGSDRFDNSGDAQQGFWFFQNAIGLGTTALGGGTSFTGVHKNGDLLIISDFSNGGAVSTITIYKWNSAVSGNLQLLQTSNAANCLTASSSDAFCGLVNAGTITMPWPFLDKSGTTGNQALNGEFYEGGVNLSTLGLAGECFASVASETRSSTSTTATLKDFVLGNFGKCDSTLTTTASGVTGGTIGTGSVSSGTDSATLTINGISSWTGTMDFYLCGPDAALTTCTTSGVHVTGGGSGTVNNNTTQPISSGTATLTSAGHYCWFAKFTSGTNGVPDAADQGGASECFDVSKVTPGLSTQASSSPNSLVGATLSDTATLSDAAGAPGTDGTNATYKSINATPGAVGGSISWTAFGPNDCTTSALSSTSRNVNGNGTYPKTGPPDNQSAVSFTANAVGTYTFVASYDSASNANTNSVTAVACGSQPSNEKVTVTGTASLSTAQSWVPNDTAHLTGDAALNGPLTFKLYNNGTCNTGGTVLYSKTTPVTNAAGAGADFSTDNSTTAVVVSPGGSYSWLVHYDDNVLTDPTDSCEKTDPITIANS